MAQQCSRSAECRRRGIFLLAAAEVAVVENLSLRYVEGVHGRETSPSLRLNLCYHGIHDAERVQPAGAHCEQSDSLHT